MNLADAAESPCVEVCTLDEACGYCTGCYRTLEEIGSWLLYTPEQRTQILSSLKTRRIEFDQAQKT